jgi:serine/threonine protein kinase
VWACGVLAYECTVGRPPFEVDDEGETRNKIIHENTLKFPPHVSADCINFIKSALAKTAGQQRINASEGRCYV